MDYVQAVNLARGGKEEGFQFLYEETYRSKYYLALKYMKNEEAAKDVLQDAYIKAFSKICTLEKPETFAGWLGVIVANTAKNALQKQNPVLFTDIAVDDEGEDFEYEIEDEDVKNQPEAAYTQQETQELVHELLDTLPDEQKMCILMFHIEGASIREIAEALNCSENTVKSRLNYGRKALRVKAEELQHKGYKLYNMAPIPLLVYLLRQEEKVMAVGSAFQAAGLGMEEEVLKQAAGGTNSAPAATKAVSQTVFQTSGKTAAEAAKKGFLHTMTGKIAAAAIGLCVAGGAAAAVMSNSDDQAQNLETMIAESMTGEQTGEGGEEQSAEKAEETFIPITDEMYPSLLKGNLTKEQISLVLAAGPHMMSEQGPSEEEMGDLLVLVAAEHEALGIEYYGYNETADWIRYFSVEDTNRVLSVITDYQYTEENNPETVEGNVLTFGAGGGYEGTVEIISAEYTKGEMWMEYQYKWRIYPAETPGESRELTVNRLAMLKPQEDGLYQIQKIYSYQDESEKEKIQNGEWDWKLAYKDVLEKMQEQEIYQYDVLVTFDPLINYYLHEMSGDSIPELIVTVYGSGDYPSDDEKYQYMVENNLVPLSPRSPLIYVYSYETDRGAYLEAEDSYYMPVFVKEESSNALMTYYPAGPTDPEITYESIRLEDGELKEEPVYNFQITDWSDIETFNEEHGIVTLESGGGYDDEYFIGMGAYKLLINY